MERIVPALTLLLAVVIVAVAACWFSVRHFTKHSQPSYTEAHQRFHTQIGITAEQEKRLEPIEQGYAEERKHSTQMLRIANNETRAGDSRGSSEFTAGCRGGDEDS